MKLYARFALSIYCRRLIINKPELLKEKGPILIAANHPNSFLDGIILTTLMENDLYSLARGDVFKNSVMNKALRWLRLLPVYRTSEGVENLEHNYTTFAACLEVFRKNGSVLIFSEGRCENEWHLRPLRKGTARLATSAWSSGIPLRILPLGYNYSNFKRFGKDIHLNFGEIFSYEIVQGQETDGKQYQIFNNELNGQLKELVYEIPENDEKLKRDYFPDDVSTSKRVLFFLPALVGFLLHLPLYLFGKLIIDTRFRESGHYDSILTSFLMFGYPVYLIILILIAASYSWIWGLLVLILSPFTAWCFSRLNYRLF